MATPLAPLPHAATAAAHTARAAPPPAALAVAPAGRRALGLATAALGGQLNHDAAALPRRRLTTRRGAFFLTGVAAKSWGGAKTECEGLGGGLATIFDATENAELESLLSQNGVTEAWIGGAADVAGNWFWHFGSETAGFPPANGVLGGFPFLYSRWADGEPSIAACVMSDQSAEWFSRTCSGAAAPTPSAPQSREAPPRAAHETSSR